MIKKYEIIRGTKEEILKYFLEELRIKKHRYVNENGTVYIGNFDIMSKYNKNGSIEEFTIEKQIEDISKNNKLGIIFYKNLTECKSDSILKVNVKIEKQYIHIVEDQTF